MALLPSGSTLIGHQFAIAPSGVTYRYVSGDQWEIVTTKAELDGKAEGFYQLANGNNIVDFTIDGVNARVITSNNYSITGVPQKMAIFFHFYGGNYATLPPTNLYNSLINNGYSIASLSAGEGWGNEISQQLYVKLYNYVIKKFNIDTRPIAVATSMGSLCAFNIINRNLIPFKAFVDTVGVVNLNAYYQNADGTAAGNSIEAAYNFSLSTDSEKAFFGFDPYKRLKNIFGDVNYNVSCPVFFINGELDTSAPLTYTQAIFNGLNRVYSNSILKIGIGIGHDANVVTPAIANEIITWLSSNPFTSFTIPDPDIELKANNNIILRDKNVGDSQNNYIDFYKNDLTRRGLFGFVSPAVIGANGMGWINLQGNNGIFSETDSEISMGISSTLGIITKNFILNKTYSFLNLPLGVGVIPTEKLHIKGKLRIDRLVGSSYTLIDSESGAAAFLGKNTGSATFSQMIFNQGNNTTDREIARFDVNGNFLIGVTSGSERLVVNGKATVSSAPTNSTDVVRKLELDLKAPLASPAFTGTVTGITKTMVGLGSVDNTSDATKFTNTPLTGVPTAPTATVGTNTTQLATTAFVQAAQMWSVVSSELKPISTTNGVNITNSSSSRSLYVENTVGGGGAYIKSGSGTTATFISNGTSNPVIVANTSGSNKFLELYSSALKIEILNDGTINQYSGSGVQNSLFSGIIQAESSTHFAYIDGNLGSVAFGLVGSNAIISGDNLTAQRAFQMPNAAGTLGLAPLESAATTTQTSASLNSAYPSVIAGQVVIAPSVGTGMGYIKKANGNWMSFVGSNI